MSVRRASLLAAVSTVLVSAAPVLLGATPAFAHEHRTVGAYTFVVGWKNEPTYSGFNNAVQLFLSDAAGQPVTDLGNTLNVTIVFDNQPSDPQVMQAAFGKTFGTPGEYDAALVPTRPGTYTFHFTGTVRGQNVDESLTSSDKTFSNVVDPSTIQFPVKDPNNGQLAARLTNLDPRLAAMQSAERSAEHRASTATTLAVVGIALGVLGLAVGAVSLRAAGRRKNQQMVTSEPSRVS